jgi:sugar phosphate isomerase/epimerase
MLVSVATANYYYLPFDRTLEIIAEAGFDSIELDLYWARGAWAMAQHLKGLDVRDVIRLVHRSGLKVSSIHDGGGVIEDAGTTQGFVNPLLAACLDALGYAPGCIVFHTPHIEGDYGLEWWQTIAPQVVRVAECYMSDQTSVTLENMPPFAGYYIPLTSPQELIAFVSENSLGVTLDTTHYAHMGVDIVDAARVLKARIRTIHLSDYVEDKPHVFIGDGILDLGRFMRTLDVAALQSITIECSAGSLEENVIEMDQTQMVNTLKLARDRLSSWIEAI